MCLEYFPTFNTRPTSEVQCITRLSFVLRFLIIKGKNEYCSGVQYSALATDVNECNVLSSGSNLCASRCVQIGSLTYNGPT